MFDKARIFDISQSLGVEDRPYPGDPAFVRERFATHGQDGFEAARLCMSSHSGTHLDLPAHFLPEGQRLDDYPAERFVLPALVVGVPGGAIRAALFATLPPAQGMALLFKTAAAPGQPKASAQKGQPRLTGQAGQPDQPDRLNEPAQLHPEAIAALLQSGAVLVGVEADSVEVPGDGSYPVHRALLTADVLLLENLRLAEVPPGRYTLVCPPLKIFGAEASPARALLLA